MKKILSSLGLTQEEAEQILKTYKERAALGGLVDLEAQLNKQKAKNLEIKRRYDYVLAELSEKDKLLAIIEGMRSSKDRMVIKPRQHVASEGVAIVTASDWHVDELVLPEMVNEFNRFKPEIAQERAEYFFKNTLVLLKIMQRDISIKTIVLALLGDFISSSIHDDLKESNTMLPMDAVLFAQKLLVSGIEFLIENTDCELVIPCCVGNHSRITPRIQISTEFGNSLEYFMYHSLAEHFAHEKRITFVIAKGYHLYLDVMGYIIRFHHGHAIRYLGGIGGIYIPVNRAIAQWNKVCNADLDIFGHFHQFRDGGSFICNGSLIGYSPFALRIKADYEKQKQAFLLIDKKRGKTIVAPVILEKV